MKKRKEKIEAFKTAVYDIATEPSAFQLLAFASALNYIDGDNKTRNMLNLLCDIYYKLEEEQFWPVCAECFESCEIAHIREHDTGIDGYISTCCKSGYYENLNEMGEDV